MNSSQKNLPSAHRKHPTVFLILILVFGLIAVLIVIGILLFSLMFIRMKPMMMDHMRAPYEGIVPLIAGILLMALMTMGLIRMARRRVSNPLTKIMDAADAITHGDLSTRVEENSRGPFHNVERAFNRMVAELERSDKRRRDQTADISHELNTPLHIIRGYLEGIADGIYQPDEETINLLLDETSLLTRLVEDLRILSLADAGELPIHPESLNLTEVLHDLQTSFTAQAETAGVILSVNTPEYLPLFMDPYYLYRILNNLLSNAMHHTPSGGQITLTAKAVDHGVELNVADTGSGIASEDLPYIFDRFWQKEKSRQRQDGSGYGLGLSIIQQLVNAQKGQITVDSTLGEGTTFVLFFPVE